jgi:hypothetical protein
MHGDAPAAPVVAASQTNAGAAAAAPTHTLAPDKDPWGAPTPTTPTPTAPAALPTSGPAVSIAIAQKELAAAIPHLPADTSFLAAGLVGQLERDDRFTTMFDKLGKHPQVQLMTGMLPPCLKTLISGSEWFAFGSTGFMADKQGTLIVRGRWQRKDIEACFAGQSESLTMTDGTKMLQLPEVGWLDFLDANTVYVSVRQDLAAAQVHDNVKKAQGLTKHARALLATLPADREITFVVDGTGGVEWPGDPLPKGSDATAAMQTSEQAVAFEVTADVKTDAEAKALEAKLRPQLEPLKLTVARKQTSVKFGGTLSNVMMGIVASSISSL